MTPRAAAVLGLGPIDPDTPAVRVDDVGLTRGDGCFDATRVVTAEDGSSRIDNLDEHLDRFGRSCTGLDLPPVDTAAWLALIEQVVADWTVPGEALLRLMVTRGRESDTARPQAITGLLTLTPLAPETLRQRRDGIDVITLDRGLDLAAYAGSPRWLLGGVKTLSYAINVAGSREAHRRGAHDVIFLGGDGTVLEAPTATVLWLAGGVLHTTRVAETGVLGSITQRAVFAGARAAGLDTAEDIVGVAGLWDAEGVWLASSGRGVARMRSLDGAPLPDGRDQDGRDELTVRLNSFAGF